MRMHVFVPRRAAKRTRQLSGTPPTRRPPPPNVPSRAPAPRAHPLRYRKFADSPLEGDGFEPSVPRHGELMKFALTPCRRELDSNWRFRAGGVRFCPVRNQRFESGSLRGESVNFQSLTIMRSTRATICSGDSPRGAAGRATSSRATSSAKQFAFDVSEMAIDETAGQDTARIIARGLDDLP